VLEPPRRSPFDDDRPLAFLRQWRFAGLSLTAVLVVGTVGFHLIERWPWWDSFYMVLISITTVGYGEVHPLSRPGQMFASMVIISGMGVGSYVLLTATRTFMEGIVEGTLTRALARRRMERELPKLHDHTIVCGFGRLGQEICAGLASEWRPVVAIDPDPDRVQSAQEAGYHCIKGDAADEDALRLAGIDRAASIAIATASDAINTYIVLTARELHPEIRIIARASEEAAIRRLRVAGAHHVVAPTRIGGQRIAHMLVRPGVEDFLDLARLGNFPDLFIEEVRMGERSSLAGMGIKDANYGAQWKVLILAVRQQAETGQERRIFRPPADLVIAPGDALIVAGHRLDLDRLEEAMSGEER
jgi:voltage-gated potassium channel